MIFFPEKPSFLIYSTTIVFDKITGLIKAFSFNLLINKSLIAKSIDLYALNAIALAAIHLINSRDVTFSSPYYVIFSINQ